MASWTGAGVVPLEIATRIVCGVSPLVSVKAVQPEVAAAMNAAAMAALPRLVATILLIGIFEFLLGVEARHESAGRDEARKRGKKAGRDPHGCAEDAECDLDSGEEKSDGDQPDRPRLGQHLLPVVAQHHCTSRVTAWRDGLLYSAFLVTPFDSITVVSLTTASLSFWVSAVCSFRASVFLTRSSSVRSRRWSCFWSLRRSSRTIGAFSARPESIQL